MYFCSKPHYVADALSSLTTDNKTSFPNVSMKSHGLLYSLYRIGIELQHRSIKYCLLVLQMIKFSSLFSKLTNDEKFSMLNEL